MCPASWPHSHALLIRLSAHGTSFFIISSSMLHNFVSPGRRQTRTLPSYMTDAGAFPFELLSTRLVSGGNNCCAPFTPYCITAGKTTERARAHYSRVPAEQNHHSVVPAWQNRHGGFLQPKERNIRDRSQAVPAKWLEGHTRQEDGSEKTANPPAETYLFICFCAIAQMHEAVRGKPVAPPKTVSQSERLTRRQFQCVKPGSALIRQTVTWQKHVSASRACLGFQNAQETQNNLL